MPPPTSYPTPITAASASATRETPKATCLGSASALRLGSKATTAAPTSGTAMRTVNQGKLTTTPASTSRQVQESSGRSSCQVHHQQDGQHQDRAREERQSVGADEPGLPATHPSRHAGERGRGAVDRTVHAPVVELGQLGDEAVTGPHEQRLVEG